MFSKIDWCKAYSLNLSFLPPTFIIIGFLMNVFILGFSSSSLYPILSYSFDLIRFSNSLEDKF